MTSDELVSSFGDLRESRNVVVTPLQPFFRSSMAQRAIDGLGGKEGSAVWLDQSDCALELFDRNFGELTRCLLVCGVIDLTGGDFPPALNPSFAKKTFAVPDHERFGRRIGNAEARLPSHQRPTFNAQRPTFNSENLSWSLGVRRWAFGVFLILKLRPNRRVIRRIFAPAHFAINSGRNALFCQRFSGQNCVDA